MPDKSGHKLGVAAQKGLKKEENLDLVQLTNGHKLGVAGKKGDLSRGVPLYRKVGLQATMYSVLESRIASYRKVGLQATMYWKVRLQATGKSDCKLRSETRKLADLDSALCG